jgi:hypothetical protein
MTTVSATVAPPPQSTNQSDFIVGNNTKFSDAILIALADKNDKRNVSAIYENERTIQRCESYLNRANTNLQNLKNGTSPGNRDVLRQARQFLDLINSDECKLTTGEPAINRQTTKNLEDAVKAAEAEQAIKHALPFLDGAKEKIGGTAQGALNWFNDLPADQKLKLAAITLGGSALAAGIVGVELAPYVAVGLAALLGFDPRRLPLQQL